MKKNVRPSALLVSGLIICGCAAAEESPWTVRAGLAHVGFSTSADVQVAGTPVPGGSAEASSNNTLGIEVAYDISPSWTARLLVGVPPRRPCGAPGP